MIDKSWQADFQPDRRDAIRRKVCRKALVVLNSGWSTQNAEVLNLSSDGALLQFDGIGAFPESFQLRFDDQKRWCFRVWTRGLKAGVTFSN